ncbi:MAG: HesA/MoeB/ThiF family protein [Deltaproteobacteria bacterium]
MLKKLAQRLEDVSTEKQFPDGTAYAGITMVDTNTLSREFTMPAREIDISALAIDIVPERYARNMKSFSAKDQNTLLESHVTVVGTGGLGGTVSETLARIGVGQLTLVDGDRFEESNLNRQLFSTESLIDHPKAAAAADRIKSVNATVQVIHHGCNLDDGNALELISGSDVTVDCLDNLPTRFTLQTASQSAGIPMVSAAVGGQSGHLTAIFPKDQGLELIFGDPKEAATLKGAEQSLGNLPYTVTTVAALECAEIVKILLHKDSALRNRLLIIDLNDYTFETLRLV